MNELKLTINTHFKTSITTNQWNLSDKNEPERVCLNYKGKEYSLVLTDEGIKLEVWNLDENNELDILNYTFNSITKEVE